MGKNLPLFRRNPSRYLENDIVGEVSQAAWAGAMTIVVPGVIALWYELSPVYYFSALHLRKKPVLTVV